MPVKSRTRVIRLVVVAGFVLSVLVLRLFESSQSPAGDVRQPLCEARNVRSPGWLDINTSAESYGLTKPCEALLDFYIAQKTPLREFDGVISVIDSDGSQLLVQPFSLELGEPGYGMFKQQLVVTPVGGHSCQTLNLGLALFKCRGQQGAAIDFPKIRVKTSRILQDFQMGDEELDVCYGD